MSKKRKKQTLLANQKLKKRWSLSLRPSRKAFTLLFTTLIAGVLLYQAYRWVKTHSFTLDERPALQALRGISPSEAERITEKYRQINSANPEQLQGFSEQLYKNLGLRSVQLIQTSPDRLAIATEPFVPQLIAELDKLRFVTDDGIVFGLASDREGSDLPLLKGLYRNSSLNKMDNGTFAIGTANQRIVEEALLAIQEAKRYNIKYRSLTYDEFRGLSGELLEPSYRITLGFKPFDVKYSRLQKIIDGLKERGLRSATIELDYKGKAFITETVL